MIVLHILKLTGRQKICGNSYHNHHFSLCCEVDRWKRPCIAHVLLIPIKPVRYHQCFRKCLSQEMKCDDWTSEPATSPSACVSNSHRCASRCWSAVTTWGTWTWMKSTILCPCCWRGRRTLRWRPWSATAPRTSCGSNTATSTVSVWVCL